MYHAEVLSRTPKKANIEALGANVVILHKENLIHKRLLPPYCLVLDLTPTDI